MTTHTAHSHHYTPTQRAVWQRMSEEAICGILSSMEWDADDADEMVAELQAEVNSWFASQEEAR